MRLILEDANSSRVVPRGQLPSALARAARGRFHIHATGRPPRGIWNEEQNQSHDGGVELARAERRRSAGRFSYRHEFTAHDHACPKLTARLTRNSRILNQNRAIEF
jgi:hypothetical protein